MAFTGYIVLSAMTIMLWKLSGTIFVEDKLHQARQIYFTWDIRICQGCVCRFHMIMLLYYPSPFHVRYIKNIKCICILYESNVLVFLDRTSMVEISGDLEEQLAFFKVGTLHYFLARTFSLILLWLKTFKLIKAVSRDYITGEAHLPYFVW